MSSNSKSRNALSHSEIINDWNKNNGVTFIYEINESTINISYNGYKLEIIFPKSIGEFYIIDSNEKIFEWMDDINMSIIEDDMNFKQILSYIHNKLKSLKPQTNDVKPQLEINPEIEYYKKKTQLETLIESSVSPLATTDVSGISKLFNNKIVPKLIIEEYMQVWKNLYGSDKITIDLINNNIYTWSIKYYKFDKPELNNDLIELNKKYGYNNIELQISFHSTMYPNYPPAIKLLRPRLENSLMHSLANTKMIRLEYWVPSRDMVFVINNVYKLLNKHAKIQLRTELNNQEKNKLGAFFKLENSLVKLSSFIDSGRDDDIDDAKYEKVIVKQSTKSVIKSDKYWASGTGYGHTGCSTWDVNAYIKIQEDRDKQIKNILNEIVIEIQESKTDPSIIYNSIKQSLLISYIKSSLNGVTLLEISKHPEIYKIIFNLLGYIANEDGIFLFHDDTSKPLFKYLEELNVVAETALKLDKTNVDDIVHNINIIYGMIKPVYDKYLTNITTVIETKSDISETIKSSDAETYIKTMTDLKFDTASVMGPNYYWKEYITKDKGIKVTYQKRMIQEFTTLQQSLPVHYEASIFTRADPENISAIRALMIGPKDTPYEGGCFIFDIYIPTNYPTNPPAVWYITHGGKRFNPNLYDSGKVCLSLIGTWNGDKGAESWNPKTSTLFQVLVSIQSQILTENPYFNEPGQEVHNGTPTGKIFNDIYNNNIRYFTMCHTILDLLLAPEKYPQFINVIKKHFYLKKNVIINTCAKWVKDAENTQHLKSNSFVSKIYNHVEYNTVYNKIIAELNKLTI